MDSDFLCVLLALGFYLYRFFVNKDEENAPPPVDAGTSPAPHEACPSCGGYMRLWDGQNQCWECGYVTAGPVPFESSPSPELAPPLLESELTNSALPEPETSAEEKQVVLPESGTLVLSSVGPNYYKVKKIISEVRPDLSTFDIYQLLKHPPLTVVENLPGAKASAIKQRLEEADCTVHLE